MLPNETLQQVSPKDKPWETHKTENAAVGGFYAENPCYIKYARRMAECADWLEFAEVREHDKRLKLTRASFCHIRHCPVCTWRKSLARIARCMNNLHAYLEDFPNFAYLFVTLTSRNCAFDEIRATIKAQNDGVKKLLKRLGRAGMAIHGFIRVNEVTKGQDGLAHPHIHLILAVNKSYFSGRSYVPQKRWTELWREVMGLDYQPLVNVKRVKMSERKKAKLREEGREPTAADDLISGLLEVSKYAVKPGETAEDAEYLYAVTEQCHRLRFLGTGGCLKDIYRDGAKDAEDISDEEMIQAGGEDDQEKAGTGRQLYLWAQERRRYRLALRRKAAPDRQLDDLEFREGLTAALRARSEERRRKKEESKSDGAPLGVSQGF